MTQALEKKSNPAPDVAHEKSGVQGDLVQSNGLVASHQQELLAALRTHAGDSSSTNFLKDLAVPLALSKDVVDEHRKLKRLQTLSLRVVSRLLT